MKTNLFHIGYHKTATTWFQKEFYSKLKQIVVDRKDIQSFFYDDKEVSFPVDGAIFCDEELSGNIHNGGLSSFLSKGIAQKISLFKDAEVILFIRNQREIIASSYLQYVKEGGTYSVDRYLYHQEFPRNNRASLFSFSHFDYYNKIRMYEKLVGKNRLHIYLYEDFVLDPKEFMAKFIETHNLNINLESVNFKKNNPSYSYFSLFFGRIMNIFSRKNVLYKYYLLHIPFIYKYTRALLSKIHIFPVNHNRLLGSKNISLINKRFESSNQKLSQEYKLNLEKYNYPL